MTMNNSSSENKVYVKKLIASSVTMSFILAAFGALLITYYLDPHFNSDVIIYQFDFMPSDYKPEQGNYLI